MLDRVITVKYQANRDYNSNDIIMTPASLCNALYLHFRPQGKILEPCKGTGNFYNTFSQEKDWCEITENRDFFDYHEKVSSIMTNPPWSDIRNFLCHSMDLAQNIYLLLTINHIWTKARLRDIRQHRFGIKEICMVPTPRNFPQSGFQLGMVHLQKEFSGLILLSEIKE